MNVDHFHQIAADGLIGLRGTLFFCRKWVRRRTGVLA